VRIGLPSDVWDAIGISLRMARINLGDRPTQGECLSFMVDAFLETCEEQARQAAREHPAAAIRRRTGCWCAPSTTIAAFTKAVS
jgi:hypothetical protein